jgi:hypothetical protein
VPLPVVRCPIPFQSSMTSTPLAPAGTHAACSLPRGPLTQDRPPQAVPAVRVLR